MIVDTQHDAWTLRMARVQRLPCACDIRVSDVLISHPLPPSLGRSSFTSIAVRRGQDIIVDWYTSLCTRRTDSEFKFYNIFFACPVDLSHQRWWWKSIDYASDVLCIHSAETYTNGKCEGPVTSREPLGNPSIDSVYIASTASKCIAITEFM